MSHGYWRVHQDREILRAEAKKLADKIVSLTNDHARLVGKAQKLETWMRAETGEEKAIEIPIHIKQKPKSILSQFVHHRNLLVRGQIELGIILGLINTGMLLGLFLRGFFQVPIDYVAMIVLAAILLVAIGQYFLGFFYDKKHLIEAENDWITTRTPALGRIEKAVGQKCEKTSHMV